jgi:hypothetical protein
MTAGVSALSRGVGWVLLALFISAAFAIRVWPGRNGSPVAGVAVIAGVFLVIVVGRVVYAKLHGRTGGS